MEFARKKKAIKADSGWVVFLSWTVWGGRQCRGIAPCYSYHTVTILRTLTKLDKIKQNKIEFVLCGSNDDHI